MKLWPSTLVLVGGCAQIFGLDPTSAGDAAGPRVSLQLQRVSVGATVVEAPLDLAGQSASFLVDDGAGTFSPVAAELSAPGTFSAELATGTPPVQFTLPDVMRNGARLWAMPSRDRLGNFIVFEHPAAEAPAASSQIAVTVALPSAYASETLRIEAVGAWMRHALAGAELPAAGAGSVSTTLAFSGFTPMTSAPAAKITSSDVVLLLRYAGNQLTGVLQKQFDQTDGTDALDGTMTAVAPNMNLAATVTPAAYQTRYNAANPAVGAIGMSWSLAAAPGHARGVAFGPQLHAGGVAATGTMITAAYGNPFDSLDWKTALVFSTSATRAVTVGGVATSLAASLSQTLEVNGAPVTLDLPAGLPIEVHINLTTLSSDGAMVTLDLSKAVQINAVIDRPTASAYGMTLVELSVAGGAVTRRPIVDAITTGAPSFALPPQLFEAGKTYTITFRSYQGGFASAAQGDLQTFAFPVSIGALDSGAFTVVAQ